MVDFEAIIETLVEVGFYSVLLPFILVYAVVFAILQKSKIFSYDDGGSEAKHVRNINSVIAFVFAIFVVASLQTVMIIENLIINVVIIIIFMLVVLILLGMIFGSEYQNLFKNADGQLNKKIAYPLAIIIFLIALGILFAFMGVLDWLMGWWGGRSLDNELFTTIVVIGLVAAILFWITNGGSSKK